MELGRYLARELCVEEGVDTLGRWMAHYLAELIDKAENSPKERDRKNARREATETILRIWEHRRSLPGKVYPIERFKDIFLVLDHLLPDRDPFSFFPGNKVDKLSSDLFTGTARLIPILLLKKVPIEVGLGTVDPIVMESLNENEQYLLSTILYWMELFMPVIEVNNRSRKPEGGETGAKEVSLDDLAYQTIEELITTLKELEKVLKSLA